MQISDDAEEPTSDAVASGRIVAILLLTAVLAASCASREGESSSTRAGDSATIRDAAERRVESEPTGTIPLTAPSVGPVPLISGPADGTVPTITSDEIAELYTTNGPGIEFTAADITEGDNVVMQVACELLVAARTNEETLAVHGSYHEWFDYQLTAAGAPPDYIASWDPSGILDALEERGCTPAAASPAAADLG